MPIESLTIRNFKLFEDITIHLDPQANIFTGLNNSGKTTVLEALALWGECFRLLLRPAGKSVPSLKLRQGDLRLGDTQPFILNPSRLHAVRQGIQEHDLFYGLDRDRQITLSARVSRDGVASDLPFTLRSARVGSIDLRFAPASGFNYELFRLLFPSGKDPVDVLYASPISALLFREDFETLPKIQRRIRSRESMLVLRNRLYQLAKDRVRFADFCQAVSRILYGEPDLVHFRFDGDERSDVELAVLARLGSTLRQSRDIALEGSGALQIIELMLALFGDRCDLTLILLDEPDSHIHRDIQRRLLDELSAAPECQVFMTSHNESLIRASPPHRVFHLEPGEHGDIHPIARGPLGDGPRYGLQPSPYRKILSSLGSETALDFVNALEADRLVLVEGDDDARRIQGLANLHLLSREPFRGMYWAFGGVDEIFRHIGPYRRVFEAIRNGTSLWEKAVLIFDRDVLTEAMATTLAAELSEKLRIPVYIWRSYCLEATLLSEPEKLVRILTSYFQGRARAAGVPAPDPTAVAVALTTRIEAHRATCLRELADAELRGDRDERIFNLLKKKREALSRGIQASLSALKVADAALLKEYYRYAQQGLQQGKVDHVATKGETFDLLNGAATELGFPLDEHRYFDELLLLRPSPADTLDQWSEVASLLRSPLGLPPAR